MKPFFVGLLAAGAVSAAAQSLADVNVFLGTERMGHTFPGAVVPFGMVQLSPDTRLIPYALPNGSYNPEVYGYCAGYQYEDRTIFGFSHTHFSGTGHSDLGDFSMLPVKSGQSLLPGDGQDPATGYFETFDKQTETAEPGYYRVHLERSGTVAELSASTHAGFHRYTYPAADSASLLLDLVNGIYGYDGKILWSSLRVENDTLITGYRHVSGWARDRYIYFAASFSRPISSYRHRKDDQTPYRGFYRRFKEFDNFPEMAGKSVRAEFTFAPSEAPLEVVFAISGVSTAGALANLRAEAKPFDAAKAEAQARWLTELRKIEGTFLSADDQTTFYTALYHSLIAPHVFQDVDGQYRGLDGNVHRAEGFTNLTVFSLWDTYRALHPWFNFFQPEHNRNAVLSMLAHGEQSVHQALPVWSHWANENWCMIGYHGVSVLADAAAKGMTGVDWDQALKLAVSSSGWRGYDGLGAYMDMGYVPEDVVGSSVSKTLEYAYDDWCVAELARRQTPYHNFYTGTDHPNIRLNKAYLKRAQAFKNTFDPQIRWARPRLSSGAFKAEFDLLSTHNQGFIEGNAWNYSFYVPQDVPGLIQVMGGEKVFVQRLDSLFTMELPDEAIAHTEDVTRDGILGNYVHGNEPSHHIPYLYNWTQDRSKTQYWVRRICRDMYGPETDGLCGNDDAGQMSAWYLFSSLGFYPVTPGAATYELGSPSVKSATIQLENGNRLQIETVKQSPRNVYVKDVLWNGQALPGHSLYHQQLIQGGTLTFVMSPKPAH